jgi:hypothetical protein
LENSRAICNKIVTEQLTSMRTQQDLSIVIGGNVSGSSIEQTTENISRVVAGMMVENVMKACLKSESFSGMSETIASDNKAKATGLNLDLAALLGPLLVIGCVAVAVFLVGPLKMLATIQSLDPVWLGVLAGLFIVGALLLYGVLGYIVSGVMLAIGLVLVVFAIKRWNERRGSRAQGIVPSDQSLLIPQYPHRVLTVPTVEVDPTYRQVEQ